MRATIGSILIVRYAVTCRLYFVRKYFWVGLIPLLICWTVPSSHSFASTQLPEGFTESIYVQGGLDAPVSMDFSPDGRLFVCQKGGFGLDSRSRGEAAVRIVKNGVLLADPFCTLTVMNVWEAGLMGIAFDPNFGENRHVYLSHSMAKDGQFLNRVIRLTASIQNPDKADPDSLTVIVDDIPAFGFHNGGAIRFGADGKLYYGTGHGTIPQSSQDLSSPLGKILRYNPDGSIPSDNPFVGTPDAFPAIWAYGLRNVFTAAVDPVESGGTGTILINDVGEHWFEEVNELQRGKNYGWPLCEGSCAQPDLTPPLWQYSHQETGLNPSNCLSAAVTGGTFYRHRQFPEPYRGKYFVTDYIKCWIKVVDPATRQATNFAAGANNPIDVKVGPDGSLYYLSTANSAYDGANRSVYRISYNRHPEVIFTKTVVSEDAARYVYRLDASGSSDPDGDPISFQWLLPDGAILSAAQIELPVSRTNDFSATLIVTDARGGERHRVIPLVTLGYSGGLRLGTNVSSMPLTLSGTGAFKSLAELTPSASLIPYEINTPLWSDGAVKRRWIALPPNGKIRFSAEESWIFPPGTALIKHFELPPSVTPDGGRTRRLGTRFFVRSLNGDYFGVTYKWRADGSDADLLTDEQRVVVETAGLPGGENRTWDHPSPGQCLQCHRTRAGYILGVNARQLNRLVPSSESGALKNQLRILSDLGVFDRTLEGEEIISLPRLRALTDKSASLEDRVKSYLDANCAHCHRPDSRGVHAFFDARYSVNLADQRLIDGPLMTAQSLGINNPQLVVPHTLNEWGSGSMLYLRMIRQDQLRMPPLGTSVVDTQAVEIIKQWIDSLPLPPPTNSMKTPDLLLQNPNSGDIYFWLAPSEASGERQFIPAATIGNPDWTVLGIDDFNGDLNQDLLWRHPSGQMGVWITAPTAPPSEGSLYYTWTPIGPGPASSSDYIGSGDFDNDGETDLFWLENYSRRIVVWLNQHGFNANSTQSGLVSFPSNWRPLGVADFDLDGQLDLVCENLTNRQWGVWLMDGLSPKSLRVFDLIISPTAKFLGVVDGNGDAYPDLQWKDDERQEWFYWAIRDLHALKRVSYEIGTDVNWRVLAPSMARDRLYPARVGIASDVDGTLKLNWNATQADRFFLQSKGRFQEPIWQDWLMVAPESDGIMSVPVNPDQPSQFFRLLQQNAAVPAPVSH